MKLLSTIALQSSLRQLLPGFSGAVVPRFDSTAALARCLHDGEAADALLGARRALDELLQAGLLRAQSLADLARSGFGIAVRAGAPRPDISTPASLKDVLLAARGIAVSNGPSGAYFVQTLAELGIAEQLEDRILHAAEGGFTAQLILDGEAELAFQQNVELLSVPGVTLLGPLPARFQRLTVFSAAVPTAATDPAAGTALIHFLQAPAAAAVMKTNGLEPVRPE